MSRRILWALKDDAGLVKKYAMVNVQKYQIVAIGDSVSQCQENYNELLLKNGVKKTAKDTRKELEATGNITEDCTGSSGWKFSLLPDVRQRRWHL